MKKVILSARTRRRRRVRAKISGTASRPRISVFRSNRALYAQLIDDENSRTILGMRDAACGRTGTKTERAARAGEEFGRRAAAMHVAAAVFDRNGYAYRGRIKAFADGVRTSGIVI